MNFEFLSEKLHSLNWPVRRREGGPGLGRRGERAAEKFLKRRRYRLIARNYRCAFGEIDLICSHGDTIVFVEVKTRSSDDAQEPQEAFRPAQWRRAVRAARCFLSERATPDHPGRFDLVTVVWPPRGAPRIEHFEDAFQARAP